MEEFTELQRALAGRFSLDRELGRGGMGVVYLARDVALDRLVAIKLLPRALAEQLDYRARFLKEARTAAALSHPNIVPIHLVEEKDGLVYFVMAYVDGESLGDRVRRTGPLKPPDAAKVVQEVAWALGYAHSRGVIHRDIKPDNILIDGGSGRAMVMDFGIARVTTGGTISQQGEVLGTLHYMSPEQASAESVIDGRADLYSLGVTAFFALTGRLPFESHNPGALVAMHLTAPPPPVMSVFGGIPVRFAAAVDRCLVKDPAGRFPDGEALADAIADAQITRREIAPSVREFLGTAKSAVVLGGAGLGLLWYAAFETATRIVPLGPMIGHPLDPLLAMLGALTGLAVIVPLLAARGLVRAGFGAHDVAEAAASSATARDANVEYELERIRLQGERLATPPARLALLAINGTMLWWIATKAVIPDVLSRTFDLGGAFTLLLAGGLSSFLLALTFKPKQTVAVFTRGTPENAGILRRFWIGPVGRALFAIAGLGLTKRKALPVPESAPAEVNLARAADQLFEQLPNELRARLGDMPQVIAGLERAAVALRARRDDLAGALADVGEPEGSLRRLPIMTELNEARGAAEERLGTAVTALENLRLDLLRLRAGIGRASDLTAAIDVAREVGRQVDAEIAARVEVESIVGRDARAGDKR